MKSLIKLLYHFIPFKFFIFSVVKAIIPLPHRIYKHLHFHGIFRAQIAGTNASFLLMHYGFQVENEVFWKGVPEGWEPASLRIWLKACEKSQVILDVGANTGLFALVAKALRPKSEVFAFEPVARVFEKLKKNCELNEFDIHCFDSALSNSNGEATIFDSHTAHTYSVTVNKNLNPKGTEVFETKIRTERLDTFWKNSYPGKKIDLIKLDVETHEREVLEGMGALLREHKPAILIEIISDEVAKDVENMLGDLQYQYYSLDDAHPPKRSPGLVVTHHKNWFVCSAEMAQKLNLT